MKIVSDEDIKKIAFEGLCYFKRRCDELGIRYYLAYGTLIGAVRHQGFIPWDDDIDLLLPRSDYDRIMKNPELFENSDWHIVSNEINKGYCLFWPKLCNKKTTVLPSRFNTGYVYGLSIDLFPLDFFDADNVQEANDFLREIVSFYDSHMKRVQVKAITSMSRKVLYKKILQKAYYYSVGKLFGPPDRIISETNNIIRKRCKGGKYAAFAYDSYFKSWNTEDFGLNEEPTLLKFEDEYFSVPKNYDGVLRSSYGDYMILPPEEKQISNHVFTAIYNEQ